ncbi:MAG: GNAT family N-acetyltransferase [Crocinitomicaceae bacterium]|nr:GNAT family N-acetyltransferase [Crocinitomicaceae bacterium]
MSIYYLCKMLSLIPYTSSHFIPLSYQLNEEQAQFTTSIDDCINKRKDLEDNDKSIIVIQLDETPIGFFILDKGIDRLQLTENPKSLLMRSYSINPKYQGKGYGKKVMELMDDYIRQHYNSIEELVLSVNMKNQHAYHVYLKSGFQDTGSKITGIRGSQYVLSSKLH